MNKKRLLSLFVAVLSIGLAWSTSAQAQMTLDDFDELYADLFPGGDIDTEGTYIVGTDVGFYDADIIAQVQEVLAEVMEYYGELDDYTELAEKLQEAYDLLNSDAARIPFTEGYYYMVSAKYAAGYVCNVSTEDLVPYATSDLTLSDILDDDDNVIVSSDLAYAIWQYTAEVQESGDTLYAIKNLGSGRYIDSYRTNSSAGRIPLVTETDIRYSVNLSPVTDNYGFWNMYDAISGCYDSSYSLNVDGTHSWLIHWTSTSDLGSCWRMITIPEEEIEALGYTIDQEYLDSIAEASSNAALYSALSALIDSANSTYMTALNGFSYDGTFDSPATGLVTESSQLSTNAQEPTEGDISNLVDGSLSTFFHTAWSGTDETADGYLAPISAPDNLVMHLNKSADNVIMKYAKRAAWNYGTYGEVDVPVYVTFYVSDDGTSWTELLSDSLTYEYSSVVSSTTYLNFAGTYGMSLGGHSWLRMDVINTYSGSTRSGDSYPYWYWTEVRVYEPNDTYSSLDEDIRTAFEAALSNAETVLADSAYTSIEEATTTLREAYAALLAVYRNVNDLSAMVSSCRTYIDAASEASDAPGYYESGAIATFEAALDAIADKIATYTDGITVEEYDAIVAKIKAAQADFDKALILPTEGSVYYLQSESTAEGRDYWRFCAVGNGTEDAVALGGWDSTDSVYTDDLYKYVEYLWMPEYDEEGKLSLYNLGTGMYMASPDISSSNSNIYMSFEPGTFTLETALYAGAFHIIVSGDTALNVWSSSLGTWTVGSGADNSAFSFVEVTENELDDLFSGSVVLHKDTITQIITLPYTIDGGTGGIYTVIGQSSDGIELEEAGEVAAGTPFVFIPSGDEVEEYWITAGSLEEWIVDLNPSEVAEAVNGLQGTLQSTTVIADYAYITEGSVALTESGTVIAANSGYFTPDIPSTTTGDETLPFTGSITGIESVIEAVSAATADDTIYTLAGVKVGTSTDGLAPGVYIQNGKRILVK